MYGESGWLLQARIVEFAKGVPGDRLVFGTDSPPNDPGMDLLHLEVLGHLALHRLSIDKDHSATELIPHREVASRSRRS